jgi:cell division protein FtsB
VADGRREGPRDGTPPAKRRHAVLGFAALCAVILAIVSAAGPRGLRHYWKLRDDARSLAERNASLATENETLRREVRLLHEDPKAIERAAREDLGMIGKDEVVFTFE